MSVQFNEEQPLSRALKERPEGPSIRAFLVNAGIAKDTRSADILMLGIIGILVIITVVALFSLNSSGGSEEDPLTDEVSLTA